MVVSYFILSTEDQSRRLLSYTGTVKAGKLVLTLKVEIADNLSYVLEQLEEIQATRAAKPKAPKPPLISKQKAIAVRHVLGLPSPDQFAD